MGILRVYIKMTIFIWKPVTFSLDNMKSRSPIFHDQVQLLTSTSSPLEGTLQAI